MLSKEDFRREKVLKRARLRAIESAISELKAVWPEWDKRLYPLIEEREALSEWIARYTDTGEVLTTSPYVNERVISNG